MMDEEARDYCLSLPGVRPDYPLGPEARVFKITSKMFAMMAE
jgi:predicted DNA-binding protein (MmcQ/YjbR family)